MSSLGSVEKEDIGKFVDAVTARGWQDAAVFLLEIGRPLTLIAGQLMWVLQPSLRFFVSRDQIERTAQLLEQPGTVDALIDRLESVGKEEQPF